MEISDVTTGPAETGALIKLLLLTQSGELLWTTKYVLSEFRLPFFYFSCDIAGWTLSLEMDGSYLYCDDQKTFGSQLVMLFSSCSLRDLTMAVRNQVYTSSKHATFFAAISNG